MSAVSALLGRIGLRTPKSAPQAMKRGTIFGDLAARVELVPFPIVCATTWFGNLRPPLKQMPMLVGFPSAAESRD